MKMIEAVNALNFINELGNAKLPIKTAYKISKLSAALHKELEFYQTSFSELVNTYGEVDESGNLISTDNGAGIKIKAGKEAECSAKVVELQNLEIELPDIQFSPSEFDGVDITLSSLEMFMPFFDDTL